MADACNEKRPSVALGRLARRCPVDCGPAHLGAEYGGGGNQAKERLGLGMKEAEGEGRGLAGKFAFVEIRTTDG